MRELKVIQRENKTQRAAQWALGIAAGSRLCWRLAKRAAAGFAKQLRHRASPQPDDAAEFVLPFDGEPLTHMVRGATGGLAAIVIEPVVLTPLRAKFADFLGGASAFALMVLSFGFLDLVHRPAPYWWFVAAGWPWLLVSPIQKRLRDRLRRRSVLMFTASEFSVRHGAGKTTVYDREIQHRFRLDPRHKKARKEAEQHELIEARAGAKGQIIRKTRYHRETLHLMIDYRGQPRKVMEIMGQDDALLVWARVKAVDEEMDKLVKMGHALAKGPKSEWDDMAGAIPDKV
jgi:hypothetical protein